MPDQNNQKNTVPNMDKLPKEVQDAMKAARESMQNGQNMAKHYQNLANTPKPTKEQYEKMMEEMREQAAARAEERKKHIAERDRAIAKNLQVKKEAEAAARGDATPRYDRLSPEEKKAVRWLVQRDIIRDRTDPSSYDGLLYIIEHVSGIDRSEIRKRIDDAIVKGTANEREVFIKDLADKEKKGERVRDVMGRFRYEDSYAARELIHQITKNVVNDLSDVSKDPEREVHYKRYVNRMLELHSPTLSDGPDAIKERLVELVSRFKEDQDAERKQKAENEQFPDNISDPFKNLSANRAKKWMPLNYEESSLIRNYRLNDRNLLINRKGCEWLDGKYDVNLNPSALCPPDTPSAPPKPDVGNKK